MNEILPISAIPGWSALSLPPLIAQDPVAPVRNFFDGEAGATVLNLLKAVGILILFWIGATIVAAVVRGILNRTSIDNKIAAWVTGNAQGSDEFPIEKWTASIAYWLVMLLGLVAFLNALELEIVSTPITSFLEQIFDALPKIGAALLWLALAWVLATAVKLLVTRGLERFRLDDRLAEQTGGSSPFVVNETLANALYWFIFLLFLPNILGALGQDGLLQPIQELVAEILNYLPNVAGAVIIGIIGWLVARVVRGITTNLLAAVGTDRIGEKVGLRQTSPTTSLSGIIGTIVYVFILILFAIQALETLQIEAISEPATAMLNDILTVAPQIFTAAAILVIFFVIGRYVADFVTDILTSVGFNNIFSALGLPSPKREETPPTTAYGDTIPGSTSTTTPPASPTPSMTTRTPSEVVGIIVLIAIVLFGAIAAVEVLQFEALKLIVAGLLAILGRVIVGALVFGVGLYLANLVFNLIVSTNTSNSRFLGQSARVAIIILVSAMALQQIGIAPSTVNLAFGLLLGAFAVAIALAFGLGGREVAGEQVREWLNSFKDRS